ncbi:hypothetical protein P4B35_10555 [Pontiellaceae bacterium B12227]|nr:hypothetical protein [Pontiellaceae bacterium B12227]
MKKLPTRLEGAPEGTPWNLEALIQNRVKESIRKISEISSKHDLNALQENCEDILHKKNFTALYDLSVEAVEIGDYCEFNFVDNYFGFYEHVKKYDGYEKTITIDISYEGIDLITLAGFEFDVLEYCIEKLEISKDTRESIKSKMSDLWYALKVWDAFCDDDYEEAILMAYDGQTENSAFRKRGAKATKCKATAKNNEILQAAYDIDPMKTESANYMANQLKAHFLSYRNTTKEGKGTLIPVRKKGYQKITIYNLLLENGWPNRRKSSKA